MPVAVDTHRSAGSLSAEGVQLSAALPKDRQMAKSPGLAFTDDFSGLVRNFPDPLD
jgi:hypothetical protein